MVPMPHEYRKHKITRQIDKMEREGLSYLTIDESTSLCKAYCPHSDDHDQLLEALTAILRAQSSDSADYGFRIIPRSCAVWGESGDNSTYYIILTLDRTLPKTSREFASMLAEIAHEPWIVSRGAIMIDRSDAKTTNRSESGRGDGIAPVTPPTPPDMRVRIRRFQSDDGGRP
jgi:hypothetical protein